MNFEKTVVVWSFAHKTLEQMESSMDVSEHTEWFMLNKKNDC